MMLLRIAALCIGIFSVHSAAQEDILKIFNTSDLSTNTSTPSNFAWPHPPWSPSATIPGYLLIITRYGADMPTNPDWSAFLDQAFYRLYFDVSGHARIQDIPLFKREDGGDHRLFWVLQRHRDVWVGNVAQVMDALFSVHRQYGGRRYVELDAVVQVGGLGIASIFVRLGAGLGEVGGDVASVA